MEIRSKLGDGIFCELFIIFIFLLLLLDCEVFFKLIFIVFKFCCLVLLLMSVKSCEEVELFFLVKLYFGEKYEKSFEGSLVVRVVKLFFVKLGDFLLFLLSLEREED